MMSVMVSLLVLIVLCGVAGGWIHSRSGHSKNVKNWSDDSRHGIETACIHPGYGEFNAHVLDLREENVSLHVGESAEISGTVEGKAFFVGNKTCHYSGDVTLKAYLGPEYAKGSWSYMSGELKSVEGLKVEITPSKTILNPGKSMPFTLKVTPKRTGTYYLYVVALSDAGWKSWTLVRVNVS